jgi:hypothetical protein
VFPSGSGLVPSAYQAFRDEVVAEVQAEREHFLNAASAHEDFGEIADALRKGHPFEASWEVVELIATEIGLTGLQFLKDFPNPFETILGDVFYAVPGTASRMAQIMALAMQEHNIPSLKEWSIGSQFAYDYRGSLRLVRPPEISEADWNAVAGPNVYSVRTPYERLNYCSVADSNVGVITFEPAEDGRWSVIHEMLWCHQSSGTSLPEWCTTRHVFKLDDPELQPWSQVLGGAQ